MPNLIHESAAVSIPLQRCRAHSAANSYAESIHASGLRSARRPKPCALPEVREVALP